MALSPRHRSSATPLALAMVALVVYASLYPFTGWRWPPGQSLARLLVLPWPPWVDRPDMLLNFAGYLPFGLLVFVAARRSGWPVWTGFLFAVAGPSALSYAAEIAQSFVPGRHPSAKDWAANSLGALAGAGLGALMQAMGWIGRWHQLRQRWFVRRSAGALALLALWPLGLLFPAPVPWGLGQVGERLKELLAGLVDDVPWASEFTGLLQQAAAPAAMGGPALVLTSALGLLVPCLLAYTVCEPGRRRLVLAAGAFALGGVAMVLSTLLNFGPAHAFAWVTPATRAAVIVAALAALALLPLPRRVVAGLALVALAALVVLVSHAPTDPYFALSLKAWEQGRFVRFHGLAQWIGWLWPFAAMAWLLARSTDRA